MFLVGLSSWAASKQGLTATHAGSMGTRSREERARAAACTLSKGLREVVCKGVHKVAGEAAKQLVSSTARRLL